MQSRRLCQNWNATYEDQKPISAVSVYLETRESTSSQLESPDHHLCLLEWKRCFFPPLSNYDITDTCPTSSCLRETVHIKLKTGCIYPDESLVEAAEQLVESQVRERSSPPSTCAQCPSSDANRAAAPLSSSSSSSSSPSSSSSVSSELVRQLSDDIRLYHSTVSLAKTLLQQVRVVSYPPAA